MSIDQGPVTDEERRLTAGMPMDVAAGFIAARRGVDVRARAEEVRQQKLTERALHAHLQDIVAMKMQEGQ